MAKMFCLKCGAELPEGADFCPECGRKAVLSESTAAAAAADVAKSKAAKKKKTIIGLSIGAVVLIAAAIVVYSLYFATPTINLNKYFSVSFDGYDGYGTYDVDFDIDAFEAKYEKILARKIKDKDKREYLTAFYGSISNYLRYNYFGYGMDTGTAGRYRLSNSDIVTLELDGNNLRARQDFGVKLKYKDQKIEVTGLKEPKSIDLFDGISVEFSGLNTCGYAVIAETDAITKLIDRYDLVYELDKNSNLTNGDEVVVTVSKHWSDEDVSEYFVKNQGKKPKATSIKIKVKGLGRFPMDISDISEEAMTQMKEKTYQVFMDHTKTWAATTELLEVDYYGSWLATPDDESKYWPHNLMWLAYKIKTRNFLTDKSFEKTTEYYWIVLYVDVINNGNDGKTTVKTDNYTVYDDTFLVESGYNYGWIYTGLTDIEEFIKGLDKLEHVTIQMDVK